MAVLAQTVQIRVNVLMDGVEMIVVFGAPMTVEYVKITTFGIVVKINVFLVTMAVLAQTGQMHVNVLMDGVVMIVVFGVVKKEKYGMGMNVKDVF
jgi:hypothetical protein